MTVLATSLPSHGVQGFLYVVALALFLTGGIVAWFTPLLGRAVAFTAWGLMVVALVAAWVQLASS